MAVDNLKKAVKLVADAEKCIVSVLADGKVNLADMPAGIALVTELVSDMSIFGPAIAEAKAIDAAGMAAVVAELASDLSVGNAKVKATIELVVGMAPLVIKYIGELKADGQKAQASPAA